MSLHVFISHSSEDRVVAQQVCDMIEARGLACWIAPRNITPGKEYASEIVDAINGCGALVLVLTENANNSKFVAREVERAVDRGRPVIPLRVREVKPGKSLELFISSSHWIDAFTSPMDAKMDQLEAALRPLCELPPAPARPTPPRPAAKPATKPEGKPPVKAIAIGVAAVAVLGVAGALLLGGDDAPATPRTDATASPATAASPQTQAPARATADAPAPTAPAETTAAPTPPPAPVTLPDAPLQADEAQLVAELGKTTGFERVQALKALAPRLPADLGDGAFFAMVAPLEGRDRTRAIDLLANHKQTPFGLAGLEALARPMQGFDRSGLFERLGKQDVLPTGIDAAQAADLMRGLDGRARRDALAALAPRLQPVLGAEALNQIANPLMGGERATAFATLAKHGKLGADLRGAEIGPALRDGDSRPRRDMIETFAPYLAADQGLADLEALLGPLAGYDRNTALVTLRRHDRIAAGLPVDGVVALLQGMVDRPRRDVLATLAPQLAGPLDAEAMVALAGPLAGYDRVTAYGHLVKAGKLGPLGPDGVARLAEGLDERQQRDLVKLLGGG